MGFWFSRYDDSFVIIYVSGCFVIPDTDKAYIAGLFDGEGSINFTRRPPLHFVKSIYTTTLIQHESSLKL